MKKKRKKSKAQQQFLFTLSGTHHWEVQSNLVQVAGSQCLSNRQSRVATFSLSGYIPGTWLKGSSPASPSVQQLFLAYRHLASHHRKHNCFSSSELGKARRSRGVVDYRQLPRPLNKYSVHNISYNFHLRACHSLSFC